MVVRVYVPGPGPVGHHGTHARYRSGALACAQLRGIDAVAPGRHVLMVDKANRELWKAEVSLAPGEEKEVGVELMDRVLEFLEAVVRSAPDDVLAWCDYGHYLLAGSCFGYCRGRIPAQRKF